MQYMKISKGSYVICIALVVAFIFKRRGVNFLPCPTGPTADPVSLKGEIDPGWDDVGWRLYREKSVEVSTSKGVINIPVHPPGLTGGFFVSPDEGGGAGFWSKLSKGDWERETFKIFNRYITANTTVVDFGTWIGPTLLYHGQYSKRSFGIEADPVAFAVVQYNVDMNRKLNPHWGRRVTVDSGCISHPADVGQLEMKAGIAPGSSMSGITDKVWGRESAIKWKVQCYALPDIFQNYWGISKPYKDIFIKIDVESYECKLIPSFYDWLKDEDYLPKMFISFHPQIQQCNDHEFEGVLKFIKLYDKVRLDNDRTEHDFKSVTDATDAKNLIGGTLVLYQDHHHVIDWKEG